MERSQAIDGKKTKDAGSKVEKEEVTRKTKDGKDSHSLNIGRMAAMQLLPTPKVGGKEGYESREKPQAHEKAISHLEAYIEYHLLPTPLASEGPKMSGGPTENQMSMTKLVRQEHGKTSQLNPRFVAEMMGFPPNWLELPFLNTETKV